VQMCLFSALLTVALEGPSSVRVKDFRAPRRIKGLRITTRRVVGIFAEGSDALNQAE
jgi:hypothetical protein